jgi:hypothetical protein
MAGRWQKKNGNLKPHVLPEKIFICPEKIIYFTKEGILKPISLK